MNDVLFLILRRMRAPLISLILAYTIAVFGLAAMPGTPTEGGGTTQLSIFHAFYVVSYTATTIGFGEVPQAFSEPQRLWMIIVIYLTVIAWACSHGA